MTKKQIVRRISEEVGLTQLQTQDVVQRTLDAILRALVAEGRIELRDFGVFKVRRRASRKARNPRTGENVIAPARNIVAFKPGKEMEERVAGPVVGGTPRGPRESPTDQSATGRSPEAAPKPRKKVSRHPA